MQNHFNTVITQTPQIILECSEWIQYELEICSFPPRGVCEPDWLGCSLLCTAGACTGQISASEAQERENLPDSTEHICPSETRNRNLYKQLQRTKFTFCSVPACICFLSGRQGRVWCPPLASPVLGMVFVCLTSFQHNSVGNSWHCTTKPDQQSYSPHQYYHSPKKAFILSSIKLLFTLYLFLYHL